VTIGNSINTRSIDETALRTTKITDRRQHP
jgi:hypothetical protein